MRLNLCAVLQCNNIYTGSQGAHQRHFVPHQEAATTLINCSLELRQLLLKCPPLVLGLLVSNVPLAACTQAKTLCKALILSSGLAAYKVSYM